MVGRYPPQVPPQVHPQGGAGDHLPPAAQDAAQGGVGWVGRLGRSWCRVVTLVDFDQVQKMGAEPDKDLVFVSRFLFFPILNLLSGLISAPVNPLSQGVDPSGVGGYMRKRNQLRAKATDWE